MAHLITFQSSMFDVTKETPNPINPIAGQSLLRWLCESLKHRNYEATAPEPEDWGWYVIVQGPGSKYLVGASAEPEEGRAGIEWTIQIHKQRSFKDKITRTNKLTVDDSLSTLIETIIRAETGIQEVIIEKNA
jgi:hypothetical protein